MSRLRKSINARDQHIFTLRGIIAALVVIIGYQIHGWSKAPDNLTVTIPPDLRSGSIRKVNDIHPSSIYAFSFYIFQQLNRWPKDGTDDYKKQIEFLSCFMTEEFKENRLNNYEAKRAKFELSGRSRAVHEIPGQGYNSKRVYIESGNSWVTYLDLQVREHLKGKEIKNTLVRYPINVVRYDVNPECNPWGLALDGFREDPSKLSESTGEV